MVQISGTRTAFGGSGPVEGPALRVLLYSHSLPPWVDGVSTRMTSHLQLLREEGHQVHALTIEPELDDKITESVESVDTLASMALHWYPAKRFPVLSLPNLVKIWQACRRSRAEVIHATMCPSIPLFFVASCLLDIPLIVSIHTDSVTLLSMCDQPWWVVRLVKILEPLGSLVCDATYTVSPSYSSILLQRGIKCLDITWGGYANPDVFHPRLADNDARMRQIRESITLGHPNAFIMAYAGRISPEKNIDFLVELQGKFKHRGVWLVLVGDGPAAAQFAPLHGTENQIHFVPGFMKQTELAELYAAVDVVTSASTFETFGYTALEAMACGTPVLVPRAQGFRDVVSHNHGGYLFDAKDQASASHYLELMLNEKTELFPPDAVVASTREFTARACRDRTVSAYHKTRHERHGRALRPLPLRLLFRVLRFVPALMVAVLTFFLWILMAAPAWLHAVASLAPLRTRRQEPEQAKVA